ncbi:MAG: hypothetical protein GY772_12380, partial [bacterium]|nr:hypothetical protein [bacterium]
MGDVWTKAVRDAISETVRLFEVTARYADEPNHPLRRIDAEQDRQEVLLGTIGVLRQQGFACLPKLSEESLRRLMGSSEPARQRAHHATSRPPLPEAVGD